MPSSETDAVVRAGRAAIARAKSDGRTHVLPDDLLIGVLQTVARFDIVRVGRWIIDLQVVCDPVAPANANGLEVAWSVETADLFDRAAGIARLDGAARVDIVHLLVAFAPETTGLMGDLKERFNIDQTSWRAALAEWRPFPSPYEVRGSDSAGRSPELLNPDEAAELLGVHTQTVRGYIRSGKLPAHRLAGERAIRILRRDVFALLEPVSSDDE